MNTLYFDEINFISNSNVGATIPSTAKWYTYDEMFVCRTTNQYNTSCFYREVSGYTYTKVYAKNLKKVGNNSAYTTYLNGYRIFVNLKEVTGKNLNGYNNLFYTLPKKISNTKTNSIYAGNTGGTVNNHQTTVYLPPVVNNGGNNYQHRKIGLQSQFQSRTTGLKTKEWLFPKKKKVHRVWIDTVVKGNLVTIRITHIGILNKVDYYFGDGTNELNSGFITSHFYLNKGYYQIYARVTFDDGTVLGAFAQIKITESVSIKQSKKIVDLDLTYRDSIVTDNSIIIFEGDVSTEGSEGEGSEGEGSEGEGSEGEGSEGEGSEGEYSSIVIYSLASNTITSVLDTSNLATIDDEIIGVTNSFIYMCNKDYGIVYRIPIDGSDADWSIDIPMEETTHIVIDWDKVIAINIDNTGNEIISNNNLPERFIYQKSIYKILYVTDTLVSSPVSLCFTNKQHISILVKDNPALDAIVYNNGNVYTLECDTDYTLPE